MQKGPYLMMWFDFLIAEEEELVLVERAFDRVDGLLVQVILRGAQAIA